MKHIDNKFNYIVYLINIDDEDDELWTYELNEDDAIRRVKIETEAYNSPEFQFRYEKINRGN